MADIKVNATDAKDIALYFHSKMKVKITPHGISKNISIAKKLLQNHSKDIILKCIDQYSDRDIYSLGYLLSVIDIFELSLLEEEKTKEIQRINQRIINEQNKVYNGVDIDEDRARRNKSKFGGVKKSRVGEEHFINYFKR